MNDLWRDSRFDDPDELHRLLSDAVAPVRPGADSLHRLRGRVRARRRQRQAMTVGGTAAAIAGFTLAAVLVGPGTTLPGDQAADTGASASASGSAADGGTDQQATGTKNWPGGTPPPGAQPIPPPTTGKRPASTAPSASTTHTPTPSPSTTTPTPSATVPSCSPGDLRGSGKQAVLGPADSGVGYGYVEVQNASADTCSVTGRPKASIVDSATGADAGFTRARRSATESPALAEIPGGRTLVLKPKAAFRFQFAWTTKPTDTDTPCTGPDSADPAKTWALRYQLEGKGPVLAQVSLPAACKGTLYETNLYLAGEYPEAFGG